MPAGSFFGFYLVQNASASDWRAANPTNALGSGPLAFFSFAAANPDGFAHMLRPGRNRYAFEDQTGGGDQDFNDVSVEVTYPKLGGPVPPTPPIPVPPGPPIPVPPGPVPPVPPGPVPPVPPGPVPPVPPGPVPPVPPGPVPPVPPGPVPPVPPVPPIPPLPTDGTFTSDLAGYMRTDLGGSTGGVSVQDGFATLTEGDRFRVGLSKAFTIPATPTAVVVSFDAPIFDGRSQGLVKDAFEIAVLGADGSPLALPTMTGRDAAFNWTEGFDALGGPATSVNKTAAMVTLTGIPAGTPAQLVMRLVNNDSDTTTSVRLRRVDFVAATGSVPTGVETAGMRTASAVDLAPLSDVTPSIEPVYGRTTLTEENTLLSVDLGLKNIGGYPVVGKAVLAISNLSDPNVAVMNPDGFTADGRPYVDLSRELGAGLMPGATTASRLVQFTNPNRERFTYDVQVLAGLNSAPRFGTLADAEATVGQTFAVNAEATDTDALTYRLLASPAGMTIDANGRILFTPVADDVGNHVVRVRVTDAFGAIAEGTFKLTVRTGQPNRPPLFTSTPPTDATVASPFEVQTYATGPNPVAITAGNFGAGVSVITANRGDQNLEQFQGQSFQSKILSVGELPTSAYDNHPVLRAADVDLGFAPGTYLNEDRDVYGFVTEDVNRDGNPDIVASVVVGANSYDDSSSAGDAYLAVRLGNGEGAFRAGWQVKLPEVKVGTFTYTSGVETLRHIDVTGDAIQDLVTVQKYGGRILVYKGRGDGTFVDMPVVTESTACVNNFQVADLNADGKPDVVRFEKNPSNRFRTGTSVLFGNGLGGFENEVMYEALEREGDGYLVDLDNKNGPDMVRLDYYGRLFNTRLNDGSGKFGAIQISLFKAYFSTGGAYFNAPTSAQFGDFNRDGFIDIVSGSYLQSQGGVITLNGNGDGTFGGPTSATNKVIEGLAENSAFSRGGDGVTRDLDGDGQGDILFGDRYINNINVVRPDGLGGFQAQSYTPDVTGDIGPGTYSGLHFTPFVGSADFNRDGVMDVLFTQSRAGDRAGALGLVLGDKPGTLRLPRTDPARGGSYSTTVLGDFTADGVLDVVQTLGSSLDIKIGRGDGTFEPPTLALNTQAIPTNLVIDDFNRDGKNDVAFLGLRSGSISHFCYAFGQGNGTFVIAPRIPFQDGFIHPFNDDNTSVSGDFNADGYPDLAFRMRRGAERQVFVLLFDPLAQGFSLLPDTTKLFRDAAFSTLTAYPDEALGYADLNGDGKGELFTIGLAVAATPTSLAIPSRLTVWQTTGGPTTDAVTLFSRTTVFDHGFGNFDSLSLITHDFNGDGKLDLAVNSNITNDLGHIQVGFGTGDFRFRDVVSYPNRRLTDLDLGDVNGDGQADLIVQYLVGVAAGGVLLGRPDGSFGAHQEFARIGYRTLSVGDVNSDGRADFVMNTGVSGSLDTMFLGAPEGLASVQRGDLNGDGKLDLVALNTGFGRVKVLLGDGKNQFARQADLFAGVTPVALELGDINKDGKLDIVTANRGSKSVTLLRNDGGSFTTTHYAIEKRPEFLALGDLNGDGFLEAIASGEQTLFVLPGSAIGFGPAFTLPLGFRANGLTLADVTGDGKLDVLLSDGVGRRLFVLPGQGNGTFAPATTQALNAAPATMGAVDLNADGKLDVVVTFPAVGKVGVLFGRGRGRFTTPQLINVGQSPDSLTIQDVDGDGKPDVLVTNSADDTLSVIYNRYDPANVLRYQATAIDPDGDTVTFSLENGPGGMLLDESTGMAIWAPMPEQIGLNRVVLRANDGRGAFAEQGFTVRVTAPVNSKVPQFTSEPKIDLPADEVFRYQPRTTAPTSQAMRYSLVNGPAGMTVNPITGEVKWDGRRSALSLSLNTSITSTPTYVNRGEIVVPDAPQLRSASVTAEGWFRFDGNPATQTDKLLGKRWVSDNNPSNIQSWAIEVRTGFIRAYIGNRAAPDAFVDAPTLMLAGQWTHLAITFDDATRRLTLYVNGVAVGSAISVNPLVYSDRPLEITPSRAFIGSLAGVRVWDRARGVSEIQSDMFRDVPTTAPGLTLDLRFKEGPDARTVEDASHHDHSGILQTSRPRHDDPERIPSLAIPGDYPVTLRVDDGLGGISEQSFVVRVVSPFHRILSGTVFDDSDGDGVRDRRPVDNLLVNGDFTRGPIGFTSELAPGTYATPTNSQRPGVYTIGNALSSLPGSNFQQEHTNRLGSAMLVTATSADRVAWAQTVPVTPGQSYIFSFWAHRTGLEPARFRLRINGQAIGGIYDTATAVNNFWTRFGETWNAGLASEAKIEIVLLPAVGTGTVGSALDDLSFQPVIAPLTPIRGKDELWLAGMATGTAGSDSAPVAAPTAVPGLTLTAGQVLTFSAVGGSATNANPRSYTPDGFSSTVTINPVNGLSGLLTSAAVAVVGVFLNDDSPVGQTPPTTLNFRTGGNVPGGANFTELAPELRQVFLLGDGSTATGERQRIVVPAGATRLFFGTLDGGLNSDNPDGFDLRVFTTPEPEQGMAGRTVFLDANRDGRFNPDEASATTDANGLYSFSVVGDAAWVGLVPEAGLVPTTSLAPTQRVNLNGNTHRIDFGTRTLAVVQPVFLSQPPSAHAAPGLFRYQAFAPSTDGSAVSYKLAVAPEGAIIDSASGLLQWRAGVGSPEVAEFIVVATDGAGRVSMQSFAMNVTFNTAPIITSAPRMIAQAGAPYRYDLAAQDAESFDLQYSLETSPAGSTIDPTTGRITWIPQLADLGTHAITVVVRDGLGGETRQSFDLIVSPPTPNTLPTFVAGPRATAQVGQRYRSTLTATDSDGDALQFSLVSGPSGLMVSADGFVLWQPTELGNFPLVVRVSDGRGGEVEQSFNIVVGTMPVTLPVSITSDPPANGVADELYSYDLIASGATNFLLLEGPRGLSIDPIRGRVRWLPSLDQLGPMAVHVRVMNEVGTSVDQRWTITIRGSALAPAFASTPPTTAAIGQTYLYPARANNPSAQPIRFELLSGPVGLSMNPATGDVTWTPATGQTGLQAVVLRVLDGTGNFSTQAFEISVTVGAINRPPVASTLPPADATVGEALSYTFIATDPEGSSLTYSIARGPAGLTIDPLTGILTWTPAVADLGTVGVTLVARDAGGAAAVQSFAIDVRTPNRAPTITNNPPATVPQGGLFRYDILATDPDREPLFFDLLTGPVGMTVDALGRVRWQTSTTTPLGNVPISVRVRDGRGGEETRSFNLGVVADTTAPRIAILIQPTLLFPYSLPARVRITVTDDVGVTGIRVLLDGVPVGLDANNSFTVPYSAPGNGRIEVFAVDAAGNEGRALNRISMRTGLENDPNNAPGEPTAVLDVVEGATVGGFVRIRGTATSPDFERYTLSYRRQDQASFTTIATGTTAVNNGELGVWDTTLLENDGYTLRLVVTDLFGGSATVERTVGVSGELKLGNFRLSFADMTIPVAGIPITIARTYDTLRADREGDFGFGWRMEFRNTDLRTSLPKSGLEDNGIYTPFRQGVRVFLTLPGGKREGFTFTPTIRVLPGFGGQGLAIATPAFTPDRGVRSTLSAGGGNLIVNEFGEMTAGGLPWNPASPNFSGYILTTKDDVRYTINGAGELTSARDLNGNTITFTEAGVTGPGGVSVTFERDAAGRITAARDPLGNAVTYGYSAAGDLVRVTDREGHTTTFGYRTTPAHYLETVTDPLGRTGIRTEYGPDGRLIGAIDANGVRTSISYDPNSQLVTTRDGLNRPTTIEYDAQGNVVASTDALGHTTRMTYNAAGDMLTSTDALGRTTTMTYDARGNLTSRTDALGNTTRMTYDSGRRALGVVDALGHTTSNLYDANGNLIRITDATGAVTTRTVSDRGEVLTVTDPLGRTSSFGYNSRGHLTETVSPNGQKVTYTVDALGNATQINERSLSGGAVETTTIGYDKNSNMTVLTGPDGETTVLGYDAAGQVNRSTNSDGRTIISYSADGKQSGAIQPGGGTLNVQYDAAGQEVQATLPNGQQVRHEYDAVGRRIASILPNGTRIDTVFDAAGQQTGGSSSGGNSSSREFDAAGRLVRMTNSDGVTKRFEYDAVGRTTAEIDALGRRTTFRYDEVGRLIETALPNGQILMSEYDAAGNQLRRTDLNGGIWTYTYAADNSPLTATDPLGNTYSYLQNDRGRNSGTTDPLGRTTTFGYDNAGRLLTSTTALGLATTYGYDSEGRQNRITDPLGRVYTYQFNSDRSITGITTPDGQYTTDYDISGRPIEMITPDGTSSFTYDALGLVTRRTDADGTVVNYTITANSRPTTVNTIHGTTTRVISVGRQLRSVTDPNGDVTVTTYDSVGRPNQTTYPGGLIQGQTYDPVDRRLSIGYSGTAGGWNAVYTRNQYGQIMAIDEGSRRIEYTYDLGGQMTRETRIVGGVSAVTNYTYDAAGNVSGIQDASGNRTFTVDLDDRLVSDGTWTYTHDAAGRMTSRTRSRQTDQYFYDAFDRLIRVERSGIINSTIQYKYHADGLLAERREGTSIVKFVWDRGLALPQLLEERDGSGALLRRYESNGVQITRFRDGSGNLLIYALDQIGSVRALLNPDGSTVTDYQYDAFGRPQGATPAGMGFGGGWSDPATGMVFLRSRWYQPESARFITRDGADPDPADPTRTVNRYIYAANDPVNRVDPTGQTNLTELTLTKIFFGLNLAAFGLFAYQSFQASAATGGLFQAVTSALHNWWFTGVSVSSSISVSAEFGISAGFTFGLEVAEFFYSKTDGAYLYYGPSIGLNLDKPGFGASAEAAINLVFDTPDPSSYSGWFWNTNAPLSLFNFLHTKRYAVMAPIPADVSKYGIIPFAFSPTATFYGSGGTFTSPTETGDKNSGLPARYSHTVIPKLSKLSDGVSISILYYILVAET
ncbi:MAG: FG-GAP-like repeat-containing protein [Fimbriiglobus sp.]